MIITRDEARRSARSAAARRGRGLRQRDRRRVPACGVRRDRRGGQRSTRRRRAGEHPRAPASSAATTTTPVPTRSGCATGMYWSGDLAYRDDDGCVYLAGRTADWMRVDGENLAAAPIEPLLLRHPGDQPGRRLRRTGRRRRRPADGHPGAPRRAELDPVGFEQFLAAQADLSPKAWPRYVRIAPTCRRPPPTR